VEEGRLVLHALLGLRAVVLAHPDVISVSDRGGDGLLRVRDRRKSYLLSPELSDFERLRETLGRVVRASAPETMGSRNAP
jgi:hypothetical protein